MKVWEFITYSAENIKIEIHLLNMLGQSWIQNEIKLEH